MPSDAFFVEIEDGEEVTYIRPDYTEDGEWCGPDDDDDLDDDDTDLFDFDAE